MAQSEAGAGMAEAVPASCPDVLLWKAPGRTVTRNEMAVQLRAAESALRKVGSDWQAGIPAGVRYHALVRANNILKVLLADHREEKKPYGKEAGCCSKNRVRRSRMILHGGPAMPAGARSYERYPAIRTAAARSLRQVPSSRRRVRSALLANNAYPAIKLQEIMCNLVQSKR